MGESIIMINQERKREYRLSVVPGKAFVDIERESGSKVNSGDAETRRESLECPIPCLTRYPHFYSSFKLSLLFSKYPLPSLSNATSTFPLLITNHHGPGLLNPNPKRPSLFFSSFFFKLDFKPNGNKDFKFNFNQNNWSIHF
jgi:hypothetical protein